MMLAAAFAIASMISLGLATLIAMYQATRQGRVGDIILHLGASLSLLGLATWCLIKGTGVALSMGLGEFLVGLVAIALLSGGLAGARRLSLVGLGFVAWYTHGLLSTESNWPLAWIWVGIICLLVRSDPRTRRRWMALLAVAALLLGVYTGFGSVNWDEMALKASLINQVR
jgi:membrane protein